MKGDKIMMNGFLDAILFDEAFDEPAEGVIVYDLDGNLLEVVE